MDLSIIIPLYNAEAYIEDCLTSVLHQDIAHTNYEIIVVNDGSSDKGPEMVKSLAKEYPQITILEQENKGNGGARNTGVDHAQGEYIYFLDADDYLAHNTLGKILTLAKTNHLDILGFDSDPVHDSLSSTEVSVKESDMEVITDGKAFIATHDYRAEIWWYLIKRLFLKKTGQCFFDRKFVQDSYYTPGLFLQAEKVSFIPVSIHRYRKSDESITRKREGAHFRRHLADMMFAVRQLDTMIREQKQENAPKGCIKTLIEKKQRYAFLIFTRLVQSDLDPKEREQVKEELKTLGAYPIGKFHGREYSQFLHEGLRFIYNTPVLFNLALNTYRKIK